MAVAAIGGGQAGARFAQRLNPIHLRRAIAVFYFAVAAVCFIRAVG